MNHTVREVAPCRKKVECAYEAAEVDQAFDAVYDELRRDVTVPGFRRGRAPRNALARRFGVDVAKDVAAKLVRDALEKVWEEDKIAPMAEPKLEPEKPEAVGGTAFAFTAEVDVRPEFELADYKGLVLREPSVEPTEADIDERLETLRESFADRRDVEEPAEAGDMLRADARVSAPGQPNEDGTPAEDDVILDEKDRLIKNAGDRIFDLPCPELVEKLTGAQAGDTVEFRLARLPDDFPNAKLRGKEASVTLRVQGVQRVTLPALDDELAKRLQADTLDELRRLVVEMIRQEKTQARHEALEEQIIDQLIERNPFDLPTEYIERQSASQAMQHYMRLAQMGASADYLRDNAEEIKTLSRQRTERSTRWSIIADAIAEKEQLEVTPEEVTGYIDQLARQQGATPADVAKTIREQNGMYAVASQIRDAKIVTQLIASAVLSPADASAQHIEDKMKK